MNMSTKQSILLVATLAVFGCEDPPVDDGADDGANGPDCVQLDPPTAAQLITDQDIERVEQLPYYASAAVDLPNGAERLGNAQLVIDVDGTIRLQVRAAGPHLLQTVFVELDLTSALNADGNDLSAYLDDATPFGSFSVNGEDGVFFQGGVAFAGFEAQSSGVFALDLNPVNLTPWPPEAEQDGQLLETIAEFTDQPIRVVGRLHGSCVGELNDGNRARVMDLSTRPDCEDIIGHL